MELPRESLLERALGVTKVASPSLEFVEAIGGEYFSIMSVKSINSWSSNTFSSSNTLFSSLSYITYQLPLFAAVVADVCY